MGFSLDKVVPWGRSFEEYVKMFNLSDDDLKRRILGCGDGPASFNASLTRRGGNVVSIDPIYNFDLIQIKNRITETYDVVIEQLRKNKDDYVWDTVPSVEELGRIRMSAMELFVSDYETGKNKRYIAGELPILPFENEAFDLALSSHFLFLYSEHLSAGFHVLALQEMLRVANEVKVFPIVTLNGAPSPHLNSVIESLENQKLRVEICKVDYEFQRGANQMLVVTQ
ncbi:MAG: SAM-dependent methyltransferase [Methylococcales bacterium]|nr:SAM-dependent methyltransferase [Methylococcales bacterium]